MTAIKAFVVAAFVVCAMGCGFAPNVTISYPIPLDAEVQAKVADICSEYHIDPAIVFAMMDVESDYNIHAVGDHGQAFGLLQVQPRWHGERINRLECWDLYDPENNVTVAVDYLAELLEDYGDMSMALVAYNNGPAGARENYFSRGVYESAYSREVLEEAQKLTEGAITDVCK